MVSCIKIETASLVFACLSLFFTSLGSLACIALLAYVNVSMINLISGGEGKLSDEYEAFITIYDLIINVSVAVVMSSLAVTFAFSIILTKGLLSKKAHLVKAYFIYGVTNETLAVLTLFYLFATSTVNILFGLLTLFAYFLYSFILMMIRKTYLKLESIDCDQFCHKTLYEEKTIA